MQTSVGRFVVGVRDGDGKELWEASNKELQVDYLICLDLGFGGKDPAISENYKAVLNALTAASSSRQDLSQYMWVFGTNLSLGDVFNLLLMHLGPLHHSFSAVQLATGQGLSFNAKRRIDYEICPRGA